MRGLGALRQAAHRFRHSLKSRLLALFLLLRHRHPLGPHQFLLEPFLRLLVVLRLRLLFLLRQQLLGHQAQPYLCPSL